MWNQWILVHRKGINDILGTTGTFKNRLDKIIFENFTFLRKDSIISYVGERIFNLSKCMKCSVEVSRLSGGSTNMYLGVFL